MNPSLKSFLLVAGLLGLMGLLVFGAATPQDNEADGILSPPQPQAQEVPQPDTPEEGESEIDPYTAFFDVPTNTPRPTFEPEPPELVTEIAQHQARAAGQSEPSLSGQVTEFTRNKLGLQFDAIVRAEVTAHRVVEPNLEIDWPDKTGNPPYAGTIDGTNGYAPWRRSKLRIIETYHGDLPNEYELLAPEYGQNEALEIGKEYVIYVAFAYVAEGQYTDLTGINHYDEAQLAALGGEGGFLHLSNTWLIDGDTAWLLPRDDYMLTNEVIAGIAAAREYGRSMAVTDLIASIQQGLGTDTSTQ